MNHGQTARGWLRSIPAPGPRLSTKFQLSTSREPSAGPRLSTCFQLGTTREVPIPRLEKAFEWLLDG